MLQPGAAIPVDAEADERAVMLVGGDASLDGQSLTLYELNVLQPGQAMTLRSERGGRAMLLGGEAFKTHRFVYWNFVSSDRERIEQAKADWQEGRFAKVPGDEEEFIPLPAKPTTVSYP
jgi:redox-sensitive bicupin YhaK (pirin superfamily)